MAYDHNIYSKIVSGELSQEEVDQLKSTGEWEEIQKILEATDDIFLRPHDIEEGYSKLIKERDKNKSSKIFRFIKPALSIAAVLLALFAITLVIKDKGELYHAENGEKLAFNLSDHSEIILDAKSTLSHSDNFKEKRQVQLEGEAYFKVAKGSTFDVRTERGTVKVLGTEFNVNTWNDRFEVECYEGKVQINTASNETILSFGERATFVDGIMKRSTISNTSPNWTNGEYRFYNESLQSVAECLERQFGKKVIIPEINRPFSGKFLKTNISEALDLVCSPLGLEWEISNETVYIKE